MRKGVIGFKENLRSSDTQIRSKKTKGKKMDKNNTENNKSNDNHKANGNKKIIANQGIKLVFLHF